MVKTRPSKRLLVVHTPEKKRPYFKGEVSLAGWLNLHVKLELIGLETGLAKEDIFFKDGRLCRQRAERWQLSRCQFPPTFGLWDGKIINALKLLFFEAAAGSGCLEPYFLVMWLDPTIVDQIPEFLLARNTDRILSIKSSILIVS